MDFYDYWFGNENIWFNSTPKDDDYLRNNYGNLIVEPNNNLLLGSRRDLIVKILIYDQLVRHVYRGDKVSIERYSKYSLNLSLFILDHNLDRNYNQKEKCFILLPLRHTFETNYLVQSLEKIKEYRKEKDSKYYVRFYKANILALSRIKPLDIDPPIGLKFEDYLDEKSIKTINPIINISSSIADKFEEMCRKLRADQIVISLSGGIDSMISSLILKRITDLAKIKLIAVTINYGNRDVTDYEVEFVKTWCRHLEIIHYVHHITEIYRNRSNDRQIYEEVTRKIRFDVYRRFNCPVFLGHNKDDCLENIFNNLKKERSLNNLRGMTEIKEENGVTIVRPMIDVTKNEIRTFAKKYNVPFLPNSTPPWSERGKIRDSLVPSINNFDPRIIKGLFSYIDSMNEITNIYQSLIDSFINKINGYEIVVTNEADFGFIFWKNVIHALTSIWGKEIPSNKSIKSFTKRINKREYGLVVLSKTFAFNYTPNKICLV